MRKKLLSDSQSAARNYQNQSLINDPAVIAEICMYIHNIGLYIL